MSRYPILVAVLAVFLVSPLTVRAEPGDLRLIDWRPVSQLVVKQTRVLRPRFPVIDIHNHLGLWGGLDSTKKYLEEMDKAGIWKCISLDGFRKSEFFEDYGITGDDFYKRHLQVSRSVSTDRFIVFYVPSFSGIDEPDFGSREARRLEEAVKLGVRGLKIHKILGLNLRDKSGKLVPVDDTRLDPVWAKCGELGIPVMIHVSDPKAFFTPVDRFNERYDELGEHPDWAFCGEEFPTKEEILAQRNRVMARHPNTVFIGAHVGNLPEELHQVGMWLDCYPNFYVETSARISELGRQPYTARKFMIKYQDRVLFGTDTPPDAEAYRIYYRFLETEDEYFDPSGGHHLQGRWMIYGLSLPDEVLEKIYNKNALKILGMFKGTSAK
ncbi:MAG: amidohydrolase [Candidatus Glassbacteria bacterium]|nr:amidohydrolase [Candidatus Glassbacteria bacterium]